MALKQTVKTYLLTAWRPLRDMFWVVPDRLEADQKDDIASEYESEYELEEQWSETDPSITEFIHDRAAAFSHRIHSKADRVRSKAKTLFNASSFASAVLLGLGAVYVRAVPDLTLGWSLLILGPFALMAVQLIRALYIAIDVMRREEAVTQSALSIDEIASHSPSRAQAHLKSAAQLVAFANRTDEFIKNRVNRLIIGQTAFRNALVWFVFAFVVAGVLSVQQRDRAARQQDTVMQIQGEVSEINGEIWRLERELAQVRERQRDLLENRSRSGSGSKPGGPED